MVKFDHFEKHEIPTLNINDYSTHFILCNKKSPKCFG